MNWRFWFTWSLRDLRQRWLQVIAIAIIIALGTGVFSGLGSQRQWREDSYDGSYAQLNMYDLHLSLTEGSYVDQQTLHSVLNEIAGIEQAEVRLVSPTLVDATTAEASILVPGRIIGIDVSEHDPAINRIHVESGRDFTTEDSDQAVVILDHLFARYYDLEPGDAVSVSGGVALDFIGTGQSPEHFQIIPSETSFFMGESTFAILYAPLASLQAQLQREGLVNDAIIMVTDPDSRAAVRREIAAAMGQMFPSTGFELTNKEDNPAYSMFYSDAEGDQEIWNLIAFLFLFGAGMATFNLAGRLVEAQRRQIGIGMALGIQRYRLAIRPLLVGLQIATLGTVLGLLFGYLLSHLFAMLYQDVTPLPYWADPFYVDSYIRAIVLGILIPFVATLYPVWRAVRVRPLEAIKTGHLIAKGGGLSSLMQYLPLPDKSFTQMPFRNLLRSPWRSTFTLMGVAIAIILLTVMVGFLDTFLATLDRAEDAYLDKNPERMTILLDTFYPTSSGTDATPVPASPVSMLTSLQADDGASLLEKVEVGALLPGSIVTDGEAINITIELFDMENTLWTPTLIRGELPLNKTGIVISEKAAADLNIDVGDHITLIHPMREGLFAFSTVEASIEVVGIHNISLRTPSYINLNDAQLMGIADLTNCLIVQPVASASSDDVRRALFSQPSVTSVQVIADLPKQFEDALEVFIGFLRIVQGTVLIMAFLIAFNSTSINVDERQREIATMFSFGLRIRTVIRMQIVENSVIGILATVIGIAGGYLILVLVFARQFEDQMPDVKFMISISPTTMIMAGFLGVLVVALTPLFSIRKMMRMDIPSTLRVME